MVLLPKFSGNAVFDQAHNGAIEAQKELQNPKEVQFLGPPADNSVAGTDRHRDQRHHPGRRGDHDLRTTSATRSCLPRRRPMTRASRS